MFKEKFKYYKRKSPPPSLADVIDLSQTCRTYDKVVKQKVKNTNISEKLFLGLGLTAVECWDIYNISNRPGLIYIRNPFTSSGQRYWIKRCLSDYSRRPNKLNLDNFGELGVEDDWWSSCQTNEVIKSKLMKKLRWATLGYHHNWNTKVYSEEMRGDFPEDLAKLSKVVASVACDYPSFVAQAAIINYYYMDSILSGHKDFSEVNMAAPLLSFSFGQSAIFLVGEEDPTALLLHSGDVVIMFAEARLAFHGVPRIVPAATCPWEMNEQDSTWEPFNDYIQTSRINMNVRQVLLPDQIQISSSH